MTDLKIEYISVDKLKPYGGNAKLHPAEQIEQIKRSIEEFGFNDPIGVWNDYEIIEGHGRYIAAQELGINKVPIIRLDGLTDEQRRAYALIHNQLTMNSGFDVDLLKMELDAIIEIDMGSFGFNMNMKLDDNDIKEAAYNESISVVIDCADETEAEEIFNKLTDEGYECRISTL